MRGGTSGSLARLQTCMYVCLSSRPPTLSMYVCMYVWQAQASMYVCMLEALAEHVCMYVSGSWACMYVCLRQLSMYVCMSQTYIHTLSDFSVKSSLQRVWICSKTLCFVMKIKHTYMLKSLRNSNITVTHQEALNYVCMFENPVFYRDKWNIHTLSFTRHFLLMIYLFESVCFKTSCFLVLFAPGT